MTPRILVFLLAAAAMSTAHTRPAGPSPSPPTDEGASTPPRQGLRYPGPLPRSTSILQPAQGLVISNDVLCLRWTTEAPGIRLTEIRQLSPPHSLTLTGELFQILLPNHQRYRASQLRPSGPLQTYALPNQPTAARLAERLPGRAVELPLRSADGRLEVVWRAVIRSEANYIRQEIDLTPRDPSCVLQELVWLDETIPSAQTVGTVDGSPLIVGDLFLGAENPHASNAVRIVPDPSRPHVSCRIPRNTPLAQGQTLQQSLVIGVAPPGQMRRAFLYYLERERAHPYRPFLHYNSWYDIAWTPFALNATNCLAAIHLWGERFIQPHGVVMDAMVFDDGWDDPQSLWQFHAGFPDGFTPLAEVCAQYQTRLGVWLSPFGGYGEPKRQRLEYGRAQGYETNPTGFSLAGPRYYAAFKTACVNMIRNYGVNHFKFDGIAAGMYASGSAEYLLDTEAMLRLMAELREEDPHLYINLTTGSWPSPFWLRSADSVWRQGGDMGQAGPGAPQQRWLTYRDQETYRNIVTKGPLYPLNSLMTQGVAYSRQGSAGNPSFDSKGFRDDVRAFFGSGTGLQELYVQPEKLTTEDWRVLAEAARWARTRAEVMIDTHWIGGDPGQLEVYGWAAWSGTQGTITLRNPRDRPQPFSLEIGAALELPSGSPRFFQLQCPWEDQNSPPTRQAEVGSPVVFQLEPFAVLNLDALPRPADHP